MSVLETLFNYHAWANREFAASIYSVEPGPKQVNLVRLLNHIHVVDRIFAAHLTGRPHGYASDNMPETPSLDELARQLEQSDRWYLEFIATATVAELEQAVHFTFTDGDRGCMTREEMLLHVVTHAAYHRGELGRMLTDIGVSPPWDTMAVSLHSRQPERRLDLAS